MLFQEGNSALVRLSDCIKQGVGNALNTTCHIIALHNQHGDALSAIRRLAQRALAGELPQSEANEMLRKQNQRIPEEDAKRAVWLDGRLHSEVLSVILQVCFTLESYINSLGYHLLKEKDILSLSANASASTVDTFLDAIDRMSTLTKWETLSRLKSDEGLDPSRSPFQDLKILFRFRDDHVHDKVVSYGDDRPKKRYGDKLPDPVFGLLDLTQAIYACDCYWGLVSEVHSLVGVPREEFHRHYNLSTWFDGAFETEVRQKAVLHQRIRNGEQIGPANGSQPFRSQ